MNVPKAHHVSFLLYACITTVVITICLRIEQLNAEAGDFLPRTESGNYNRKWRVAADVAEQRAIEKQVMLMRMKEYYRENPDAGCLKETEIMRMPFNADETAYFNREWKRHKAMSALNEWVTIGLLQYVLVPASIIWSVHVIKSRTSPKVYRLVAIAFAVISTAAGVMMFYRGYFTSLGLLN